MNSATNVEVRDTARKALNDITPRIEKQRSDLDAIKLENKKSNFKSGVTPSKVQSTDTYSDPKIAAAKAWLANPENNSSPHRAGVEAQLKRLGH
jgi:hypothetical protein